MDGFSIGIKFFTLFLILSFLRNPKNSSYIIEPVGIGIKIFALFNNIPDDNDIADHKGDILFADDLKLVADGIGVDTKGSIKFDKVVFVEIGFAEAFGLLVAFVDHAGDFLLLFVFHFLFFGFKLLIYLRE
jgi:hypothetical protein